MRKVGSMVVYGVFVEVMEVKPNICLLTFSDGRPKEYVKTSNLISIKSYVSNLLK